MYFGREAIGANNIPVYVMPKMEEYLRSNGPWSQLVNLGNIVLRPLHDKTVVALKDIEVTPFLVPHRDEYSETVGFLIKGPNKEALFIPDINKWSQWDEDIAGQVKGSDYAFLDATFFNDTELPGRDMSKIPHPFVIETMEALAKLSEKHRQKVWFIHMNHTNPLLDEKSAESKYVRAQGFNIARQGLRFSL
jgi:pyrroloquinoline quinone biosynthesis protein B